MCFPSSSAVVSQVNGVSVIGMLHSEVVAAIKAGGDQTRLLVVDTETDDFFKRCNVLPTEEHITGNTHKHTTVCRQNDCD